MLLRIGKKFQKKKVINVYCVFNNHAFSLFYDFRISNIFFDLYISLI